MKINRFIMNSNFDGQKEIADFNIKIELPSFTLSWSDPFKSFVADVEAPQGQFFANVSLTNTLIPGLSIPNGHVSINRMESNGYTFSVTVYRIDSTHYRLYIAATKASAYENVTIPETVTMAKVRLYAASTN